MRREEGLDNIHPYDEYFELLQPALKSKVEEFLLIGYGKVEIKDLWEYLTKKEMEKNKSRYKIA